MSSTPPTAPVSPTARTVVVLGSGAVQGSGALLTDRLVLTCAHMVKGGISESGGPAKPHRTGFAGSPVTRADRRAALRPPRVLLRDDAGAGKTTLLWWPAAHASARTLGPQLAELNGLVPFVVPLRTLRAQGGTFPAPRSCPPRRGR